jgi:hypothetical protein
MPESIDLNTEAQELYTTQTFIDRWAPGVQADWIEKYGEEHVRHARTALLMVAQLRQVQAARLDAHIKNAFYGNKSPMIRDIELNAIDEG